MARPGDTEPSPEALEAARKLLGAMGIVDWRDQHNDRVVVALALDRFRAANDTAGDPLVTDELRTRSLELGWCPAHRGYHRNYRCEHGHGTSSPSRSEPSP